MTNYFCYFNGNFLPLKEIRISPFDLGLLRGFAVFDYFLVLNKKPVFVDHHLARFDKSAHFLWPDFRYSSLEIKQIIQKLIQKNNLEQGAIRLVLTGGESPDGKTFQKGSFFILIENYTPLPKQFYQKGVKLITQEYQRFLPEFKTTNYFLSILNQPRLKKEKALEILYIWQGNVLEASTSNFFIFKKDSLITPKKNILLGITRKKVLELAQRHFQVEERNLKWSEVLKADEAFLTATGKGVLPVTKINQYKIGSGQPGPKTKFLMELFNQLLFSK